MNEFTATLAPEKTRGRPGDPIRGRASWHGPHPPRSAELVLFWRTEGKGDRDSETVFRLEFDQPQADDDRPFALTAPPFPHTFSGQLISLIWELELLLDDRGAGSVEITLSPFPEEISLERAEWITMDAPGPQFPFPWRKTR
ncbi:MAG TPA: hypothetical protein VIS74_05695 [Chthoniobacterales bacterium]